MLSEKYCPMHIDNIILNDQIKTKIKMIISKSIVSNMIITGQSGCGKSLLADCIANDTYGKNISTYVNKLNSSLEKNIKTLHDNLEQFCRHIILDESHAAMNLREIDGKLYTKNYSRKRMIVIDDIDNIPKKIQIMLALFMRKYPDIIFIFTCNEMHNVIEIIQSNCVILNIGRPTTDVLSKYLENICKKEKCQYSIEALNRICFISQCDIRYAINTLHSLIVSFGKITLENVIKICNIPSVEIIEKVLSYCIQNFVSTAISEIVQLCNDGYTGNDILTCMYDIIATSSHPMQEDLKIIMLSVIGKSLYRSSKRIDSIMQLEKCIIKICKKIKEFLDSEH